MLPDVLDVPVPKEMMDKRPYNYTSYVQHIQAVRRDDQLKAYERPRKSPGKRNRKKKSTGEGEMDVTEVKEAAEERDKGGEKVVMETAAEEGGEKGVVKDVMETAAEEGGVKGGVKDVMETAAEEGGDKSGEKDVMETTEADKNADKSAGGGGGEAVVDTVVDTVVEAVVDAVKRPGAIEVQTPEEVHVQPESGDMEVTEATEVTQVANGDEKKETVDVKPKPQRRTRSKNKKKK
jgi:hypothetical protein